MANTSDISAETYEAFTTTALDASGTALVPANVTGHFYDFKDHVKFNVTIANIIPGYIFDSFWVNISLLSASSNDIRNKRNKVNTSLVATANGYNTAMMTISKLDSADIPDIPYDFLNHEKYTIQYTVIFKRSVDSVLAKLSHIQEFTYYSNPVTFVTDYVVSAVVQTGDDIIITGLDLDLTGNEIDVTTPDYLTFTFQRKENPLDASDNNLDPDENYIMRLYYDASGSYILPENTLPNNHGYYMTVDAQWDLGYTTSITSDIIFVIKRPEIKNIDVLPLYLRNASADIATIDLSGNDLPGNLWFEFRDATDDVVATVGGSAGLTYDDVHNSYSFTLSELVSAGTGLFIVHGISYNVVVKKQYDNMSFDASGNSVPVYGYSDPEPVTFDLTEPTITSIVENSLYIRDTNADIATITVSHEAYELYAPYDASGILFVFYDADDDEVARTSAYYFTNALGSGSTDYPIKLSDISGNAIVNDITYTVKAAVKVTNHAGTTSYVISSESSTVTFALTEPTITAIAVNDLYTRDTDEEIATITVDHEAYELYAPYDASGILFVFYDADDTEVARTSAYYFVDASGSVSGPGSESLYPIKLSDISGNAIENGITYTVKAAVKVTDHEGNTDYVVSTESSNLTVTFALTEPTIDEIVVNDLYTRDTDEEIATITVDHEAYELYAPYDASGILFVFYDADDDEVARTSAYYFTNALGSGSTDYPIKLSDISGNAIVNDITYTVKAAVKVTNHAGTTSYVVSSESSTVTFALTEPNITAIAVNDLYIRDTDEKIATITVDHEAYQLYAPYATEGIKFVFYNGTTEVARTSAYPFVNTSGSGSESSYDIKLREITPGALVNNITYTVKAAVKVTNHAGTTSYVVSSESYDVTFDLIYPVIGSIAAYDIQNDGGQDGVFDPSDNEVDSASQIVATVGVNTAAYELYAPYDASGTSGIVFVFYNASGVEVARTAEYTFLNDSSSSEKLYNIKLNEITAATLLTNGTPYKVKAGVTLVNHSGNTELRLSEAFTDVTFTQNLAPVLSVEILNTWELVTDQDPESYRTNFLASPDIGISGHFSKNAQFGSLYLKHLDTNSTKFKLEYRVSNSLGTFVTGWTPVTKAKLVLQGSSDSTETLETAANRARSSAGTLSTVSSGEYDNIPGTGLGTSQGDIVFYIPQKQVDDDNAFAETDKVEVRVTVIDSSSPSLWGGVPSSNSTASEQLHIILKIDEYDFTNGDASEPWNSVDSGNLLINIPVSWNSEYSHSVKVSYKYSADADDSYGAEQVFLKSSYPSTVSFIVDPAQGTTLYYRVIYVVTNLNLDAPDTTTDGIITDKNVPNKYFPESSDYTISAPSYKTFNNHGESSITFTLDLDADSENRLDGVNVYFTSTDSSIAKVRIGSYTTDGTKTITLLSNSEDYLNTMDSSELSWLYYDSANISFEAFRDARVNSTNAPYDASSSALDPVASVYYVESGEQSTFGTSSDSNPIWNVPVLTTPGEDGSIELSGGVINIIDPSSNHYIDWAADDSASFTYDVKVIQGVSTVIVDDTDAAEGKNISGNSYIIPIDLVNVAKYTVEIRKVFNGSDEESREVSDPVTVVFHTVKVDTSDMDITVQNPSNTQYVNLSWNEPVFSGSSVTVSGEETSSFENNIFAHYIKYTDSSFNVLTKLGSSVDLIEQIDSPATKKQYTLPVTAIGTLYEFVMYVEAQVKYTVDGVVSTSKSDPFEVPLTDTTTESKYIVSTIPSVGEIPDSDGANVIPVLVQGSSNPVLLLNLNANGLEDEGFISVVVILTQDGTDSKPDGEQVFLVFPDTANAPFSFTNSVDTTTSGSGGDPRLAGGDESTSAPRNITSTVLSTDPSDNTYVLTIGSVDGETGRYGLSTLMMPSTSVSGFVDDSVVNYMVILTTRRGTDIGVGEFTYEAIPSVTNVYIDASGGEYYVHFTLTPA